MGDGDGEADRLSVGQLCCRRSSLRDDLKRRRQVQCVSNSELSNITY